MDTDNWRSAQGGAEPTMETGDWRTQLQPDSRQRIVNKITDTLKRHLPFSGEEGLLELKKIAVRFEEKIYTAATSQSDYLRKISLKMLTMESKSQNTIPNYLQSNSATSKNPPDSTAPHGNQGPSLPIQMGPNQQARQQLLPQNIQNNITSTGVEGPANLTSALPSVGGFGQTTIANVGQNSLQNIQSVLGVSQNGQGMSSNIFVNTQRQMQGRQQVVPQEQQQQSQNLQHYLYQQLLRQLILKQKFLQGSMPLSHMQSLMQQQQPQQQQNLLQSSQRSVMQPSVMKPAPLSGLQQNQQSSVQQSTQPMPQQNPQSVLRRQQQQQQQPQQTSVMHEQQTTIGQQLIEQQPNSTNMQQTHLIGQQNSISDMLQQQQQQQQRLLGQQNNLSNLQQQQQLLGQQNNLTNIHRQQQLGRQNNVAGLQQHQQQLLGTQPGNNTMQSTQQSVFMLQQSKVPLQLQTWQSAAALMPNQGQQSQPQPQLQQMMSQIQSQSGQLPQQLSLQQQPNSLQRDMQQRFQTLGPLLQSQNMINQQKQMFQSQRPIPEASPRTVMDTDNWRPRQGGAEPSMETGDWRAQLHPDSRKRIMNKLEVMSSRSIGTSNVNVHGMFNNRYCKCGRKAIVDISESMENPGKLYYRCANKQCNFFAWWSGASINEVRKVDEEFQSSNFKDIEVKKDFRAIMKRLRDLEANQLILKLILVAVGLGSWIIVMFLLLILMK